ncbi:MAG: hypothetical protein PHP45_06960 [Elusimicrobiales bacterium]|nr:hypothetical protein [Elusimicrobiales bacterium]
MELKDSGQAMIITQNGEAAMVISSVADVALTQEALALLKMLVHSQKAVADGKTVSAVDAFLQMRQLRGLQ